jgi:hypothetical protein
MDRGDLIKAIFFIDYESSNDVSLFSCTLKHRAAPNLLALRHAHARGWGGSGLTFDA